MRVLLLSIRRARALLPLLGRVMRETSGSRTLLCCLALGGASACTQDDFVGPDGLVAFAVSEATPVFASAEEITFRLAETRVEFPVRAPSGEQLAGLGENAADPFPRAPWVRRGDFEVEVDWTLTNLTDEEVTATVRLNGFNEFHEYVPSFTVQDEDLILDFSQWEWTLVLEPFASFSRTIQEAEMDEVEVDLATVVNDAPNSNLIIYFENQSATDERSQMYIPDTIPGLTGFRLGLGTFSDASLVLETSVRIRDLGGRLAGDRDPWELPVPTLFAPVVVLPEQ